MISTFFEADTVVEDLVKPLFFASNDNDLIKHMVIFKLVYTLVVFLAMLLIPAPYGRFTSNKYGFLINAKLAWMVQESTAFFVPLWLIACGSAFAWKASVVNKILISYLMLHYFQRSFIYASLIRGGKPVPFLPFLNAVGICGLNGLMQGLYLVNYVVYPEGWLRDMRFVAGSVLFFVGMAINIHSDHILRNLRKPGETSYKIPVGGMFHYVTSANYFGEALEWTGYAVACWNPTSAVFALFATLFLCLRSVRYQRFYKEKFDNYPSDRKLFIPFIW